MARIFVWLRYSAARKLTWQRNYNTQPRILGEAQQRLTHAIAEVFSLYIGLDLRVRVLGRKHLSLHKVDMQGRLNI